MARKNTPKAYKATPQTVKARAARAAANEALTKARRSGLLENEKRASILLDKAAKEKAKADAERLRRLLALDAVRIAQGFLGIRRLARQERYVITAEMHDDFLRFVEGQVEMTAIDLGAARDRGQSETLLQKMQHTKPKGTKNVR